MSAAAPESSTDGKDGFVSWILPVLVAALLALLGFAALDRYNVTWDEALGDFFWGERYLDYYLSLDSRYLDPEVHPYPEDHVPDLRPSPFRNRPWEYYPLANALAAATSRVLSGGLGLLDPFDGFHAVNLWLGALFLVTLWRFVAHGFGLEAAVLAVGLLALQPRVVVHALSNVKDVPEMVFFSWALMAGLVALERGSVRGLVGAGLLWGLALATKANALFLPAVIVPLAAATWWSESRAIGGEPVRVWRGRERRLFAGLLGAGIAGPLVMVLLWPWLWPDPIERFSLHLRYVSGQVFQVREESLSSPLGALLTTTTLPFLLLAGVGLVLCLARVRRLEGRVLLPLLWVGVVLGRLYLPGAVNFDGIRHFLEVLPALAMMAGLGGAWLSQRLAGALAPRLPSLGAAASGRLVAGSLGVLWILGTAIPTLRTHPHQLAWFNAVAGGLEGARASGLAQAGDYWGTSYRQGLEWVSSQAEPGSVLAVPVIEHAVALVAPLRLAPSIGLAHVSVPNFPDVPPDRIEWLRSLSLERPVYVMFVLREDWTNDLMRDCLERLDPVRSWEVDGAPILHVYRYRPPPGWVAGIRAGGEPERSG